MEMRKIFNKSIYFHLFVLLISIGCTTENTPDSKSKELEIQAIDQQLDSIEKLCLDFSVDAYLKFFDDNATIFPPNQKSISGSKAIGEFYGVFEELLVPSFKNEYFNRSIEVGDSIAVRRYENYAEIPFQESSDTLRSSNVYVDVLRKQSDGSWKIFWHTWYEKNQSN